MKNFTQKIFGFMAFMLLALSLSAQMPFWTEDFDGGLPIDWNAVEAQGDMSTTSNWFHTTEGPTGPFAIPALESTSADNGWMIFDSDLNCSGGQEAWLVLPKLDLSDKDVVVLQWEQMYRKFGCQINVQVSLDSTIWTRYPLSDDLDNNAFGDGAPTAETNPQAMSLNISNEAAGEGEVWIAFQYLADATVAGGVDPGCAYSWQIDDVALLDFDPTPPIDLSLIDYFYPPLSFATPASQISWDTMGFSGNVSNIGTEDATNVVLKATVTNNAGDVLFADSVVADVLPVGTVDSLMIVPTLYPPATDVDVYTISYELYSLDGDDADMSNNSESRIYVVTEDLWSKDNGPTQAFNIGGGNFDVGNVYWTSPNWVEDYYAISAEFSAVAGGGGTLSDFGTNIILAKLTGADDWSDFDTGNPIVTNESMEIRSFMTHNFVGANSDPQIVNFIDFDTEEPGVLLEEGTRYMLIANYEGDNAGIFHAFDELTPHDAISTVIHVEGDQWYLGGFQGSPAAYLRMVISVNVDVEDKLSPEVVADIYPNPVSNQFNLELNFEMPELVNVTIAHMDGKVISIDELVGVQQVNKQYNVSHLPAGTYLVRVTTEAGSRTQKIVVAK